MNLKHKAQAIFLRGKCLLALLLVMNLLPLNANAENLIKVVAPQSHEDASYEYYIGLLRLALSKSNHSKKYVIKATSTVISQGRAERELLKKNGLINIHHMGTSITRENKLLAIKIPLLKGSLGLRVPIIHKDNLEKFKKIKELKDLKKFIACQGAHWPDSDILEDSNLIVIRNPSFKGMYQQIEKKYCDYFPRSIIEAYSEILAYKKDGTNNLQVYDGFLLSYDFPMYFFVSPHNKSLATDIEQGLKKAIADGSFDQYFRTNPITKHLFPLDQWNNKLRINLFNRYLPKNTPLTDNKLWIFSFKQ